MITMLLIVLALIFLGLAAFSVPTGRVSALGAGLFCWLLAEALPLLSKVST